MTGAPATTGNQHVPSTGANTVIRTLDGLHLVGTLVTPQTPTSRAVVLVHGGGVTRDENGFFTRLAEGLAEADVASLRFDLRGHGESEGLQEDLTLSTILNDIRAAITHGRQETGAQAVSLLGASFAGGITAILDDPTYADPQSQEWQAFTIRTIAEWLTADS